MASGALFDIKITGVGSHGARPEAGIDPVVIGAHIITACQAIVSRNVSAKDTAVISFTQMHAGDAYNVIPEEAHIMGTARTFSGEIMEKIETNMRRTVEGLASSMGAHASLDFRVEFAATVNDEQETVFAADCAAELVGEENIERNHAQIMGSEDFSFMLNETPGAYMRIGNGVDSVHVHKPDYEFNDEIIPLGSSFFANVVETKLVKE